MARRLLSAMARMRGGPTLGGSNTEVKIYDDEALTTPSTIYRRSTGVGTQPNPIKPNAGKMTTLTADRVAGDAFVDVVSVAGFQVGDLIPVYDLVNTVYRVITAIDGGLKRLTLDLTLGVGFDSDNTRVGNADMRGHVWGFLDDTRDYYVQTKDLSSGRLMPPIAVPVRVPTSGINVQDEGVLVADNRGAINFTGSEAGVTDDAGNNRGNVKIRSYSFLGGLV